MTGYVDISRNSELLKNFMYRSLMNFYLREELGKLFPCFFLQFCCISSLCIFIRGCIQYQLLSINNALVVLVFFFFFFF
jgi:hypothetical protein